MPTNSGQFRNNHSGDNHGGYNYNPGFHQTQHYLDELDEWFPPEYTSTVPISTPAPNNASATRPNATWNRTPIRNVSPMSLRIANLPFRFVSADRRANLVLYTPKDWLIIVGMRVPAVATLILFMLTMDDMAPAAKDKTNTSSSGPATGTVPVLMGLLRTRPPIDKTDSSFQAFAKLSLPQDSDRLMERLICLLPDTQDENWEQMSDQYKASLWDIYPDTQVCGVGENDTVIVDGTKGAQIQWSGFTSVWSLRNLTLKRRAFYYMLYSNWNYNSYRPATSGYQAGLAITIITLVLLFLPAPDYLWHLHAGKLWSVEPCFFGIEGYVPLEVIEERLFGANISNDRRRLKWSAYGSPLSRHIQGELRRERTVRDKYREASDSNGGDDSVAEPLLPPQQHEQLQEPLPRPDEATIDTYLVEPIDLISPCAACAPHDGHKPELISCNHHLTVKACQDISRQTASKESGQQQPLKIFTLVDTLNLNVTLFLAARPPTVLVVAGSEGGMKRALACSLDLATGTLYHETVLRLSSQSAGHMESLPRIRLGLKRPFREGDVRPKALRDLGNCTKVMRE
ncbi:hypothetical protein VTI28DRAFT_1726 [Corynascus sepedonium]